LFDGLGSLLDEVGGVVLGGRAPDVAIDLGGRAFGCEDARQRAASVADFLGGGGTGDDVVVGGAPAGQWSRARLAAAPEREEGEGDQGARSR
jgi:hypothetical protein